MANPNRNPNAPTMIVPKDRVFERSRGCWNCVAGETTVLTEGYALPIAEASAAQAVYSEGGWQPTDGWRAAGRQSVVQVRTDYGAELRVTPDHLVHTERGWTPAGRLRVGEEVSGFDEVTLATQDAMPRDEALVVGAITGDGWLRETYEPCGVGFGFRTELAEAWKPMIAAAGELFGSAARPTLKQPGFYQIEWRNAGAANYAMYIDKKRVPPLLWRSTPEAIGAYLRGLFTADGSVGATAAGHVVARLYQTTESLVDQVALLLRSLGIFSFKYKEIRAPWYKDLYCLQIAKKASLRRFADLVGFLDTRRDRTVRDFLQWTERHHYEAPPERIRSVEAAGETLVYDLSVPETRSFYANGLLVHNCKHFENAELSRKYWTARRPQDELHVISQGGFDLVTAPSKNDPRFQSINDMEAAIRVGQAGMCLKGKVQTDFVHYKYLCEGWTGKEGASVATAGRPIDPLPAELKEIVESRAKKVE